MKFKSWNANYRRTLLFQRPAVNCERPNRLILESLASEIFTRRFARKIEIESRILDARGKPGMIVDVKQ